MRGRLLGTCFALFAAAALATAGVAQRAEDPRNGSNEYFEAVEGAPCFSCHLGQGFEPMAFSLLTPFSQLPIDEPTDIELQIRHAGDMDQALQDIGVTIDVAQAPNVQVLVDGFVPEIERSYSGTANMDRAWEQRVEVDPGAIEVVAVVTAESLNRPFDVEERIDVALVGPDGARYEGAGTPMTKTAVVDQEALEGFEGGDFALFVSYEHPVRPLAQDVDFQAEVVVTFGQEQTRFRFDAEGGDIRGADSEDKKSRVVTIPVVIRSAEPALLDFRAEVVNYWQHDFSDDAPADHGLYYRFITMAVVGGDEAVRLSSTQGPVPLGPSVDINTLLTRMVGFASLLLVPMAMVSGGVFGKGSRRVLNRVLGGAKKRVLWHNSMSFMLLGLATVHFVLALVEPGLKWEKGLFWGGIGWAVLVSLGFTGWYQVRMIKRWNYKVWRHTHLWSATGVLVFGVVHMVFDGSDLEFVRNALPAWHERLIWP